MVLLSHCSNLKWYIPLGFITLPLFSFLFALATTFLVLRLGQIGHKMPLEIMLLAGVAIGFFFSALISLGMFLAGENLHQMVFWIMGGFWNSSLNKVYTLLPFFLIGFPIIFSYSRELNTFLLGEKVAESMGVEVEKPKNSLNSYVAFSCCISFSKWSYWFCWLSCSSYYSNYHRRGSSSAPSCISLFRKQCFALGRYIFPNSSPSG